MNKNLTHAAVISLVLTGLAITPVFAGHPAVEGQRYVPHADELKGRIFTHDPACMINAVDKRDNAVIGAFDGYQVAAKKALETRRDDLKKAWGIADIKTRREAIRDAWRNFRAAHRKARHDFRNARHVAWKQFRVDSKACRANTADDGTNETVDINL